MYGFDSNPGKHAFKPRNIPKIKTDFLVQTTLQNCADAKCIALQNTNNKNLQHTQYSKIWLQGC